MNPHLAAWLERALVIGCGLGDDAEKLARMGFAVVAFDVSPTAIAWCRARFPGSPVRYAVADLFASPTDWQGAFDIVLEVYTRQVLPPDLQPPAIARIAGYVAPGGCLLVICRGRDGGDDPGRMPWPLTREELGLFRDHGVREMRFEDYIEGNGSSTRRFRLEYRKVPVPDGSSPADTEQRAQDSR